MQLHGINTHGVVAVWKHLVGVNMAVTVSQTQ